MLSIRDPPQDRKPTQTEMKGWKQIFQTNGQEKKAGVAILISDKIDFKKKKGAIKRDRHCIILKGRIH